MPPTYICLLQIIQNYKSHAKMRTWNARTSELIPEKKKKKASKSSNITFAILPVSYENVSCHPQ